MFALMIEPTGTILANKKTPLAQRCLIPSNIFLSGGTKYKMNIQICILQISLTLENTSALSTNNSTIVSMK